MDKLVKLADVKRKLRYQLKSRGYPEITQAAFIKSVERLPGIAPAQSWIPCSERLPEELKDVLVFVPDWGCHAIAIWCGDYWLEQWTDDDVIMDAVTHWMPCRSRRRYNHRHRAITTGTKTGGMAMDKYAEHRREYHKDRIKWLDDHGFCHKCGKEKAMQNRKFCPECLEKITLENIKRYDPVKAHAYQSRRREIYREKKEKGICVRCTKPATHGMHCYEHSIEAKRRSQTNAQRRKRERHERGLIPEYRKENGLCYLCGNPVEEPKKHGRACNACAAKLREYSYKQDKSYWRGLNDLMFRGFHKNGGSK